METYKTEFVGMRQELREYLDQAHRDDSPVTASALAAILEFLSHYHGAIIARAKELEGHIYRKDIIAIQIDAFRQCIASLQYCADRLRPTETLQ